MWDDSHVLEESLRLLTLSLHRDSHLEMEPRCLYVTSLPICLPSILTAL
jgi:hypothetical protein